VEIVKDQGLESLLGKTLPNRGGFDACLSRLVLVEIQEDLVKCVLPVTPQLSNTYGTLHGGAAATLVDVVGTLALLSRDHTRAGVSIDLNISFLAATKVDTEIEILGRVLRYGKSFGFTQVEGRVGNRLLFVGRHTKAMLGYACQNDRRAVLFPREQDTVFEVCEHTSLTLGRG